MSGLVERLRVLDLEYQEARTRADHDYRATKHALMAELVAETGSVTAACRALGITRTRWYQITEGDPIRSPWQPTFPARSTVKKRERFGAEQDRRL